MAEEIKEVEKKSQTQSLIKEGWGIDGFNTNTAML